jgi:hypothetical protein
MAATCDAPLEVLIEIEKAIPYPAIALAGADLALTARINDMLPDGTSKADLAQWRSLLGVRYSELGRPADALPPALEAVTIRRELAAGNPDRYDPDLADSLNYLADLLSELDRPTKAEAARQEARTLQPPGAN